MELLVAALIIFVCIAAFVLLLVKGPALARVAVTVVVILGVIKVTSVWSATRERHTIWSRSVRPLGDILRTAQYHIRQRQAEKADTIISHLNEGGLLFGTFFGTTNYPSYEALEVPLKQGSGTVGSQ
jgi:hypothetical protein